MRKALHIIAFAAVALAALVSCAKEEFTENAIPAGEPIEVSLNGLIGEFTPADATKATAESVVRVTWGAGDRVYVYDGSNASIGTLTVTPDNNNASYAMLSGTITASSASPSKLTLVYVKGATEAPTIAGGKISVDLSSQNQTEVPFVLYTTVAYDAAALTKTNEYISFSFATSVMTVNCTGLQTNAGSKIDVTKAEIDGVSTACELTIDGSGVTAVAGTTPGTITRTEITGTGTSVFQQSDSRGAFRLALAADPAAPATRNILVFQGSNVSGAPFTATTLAAGKSYNTVYQMGEYVAPPAGMLPGEFTVNASGKKVHFSQGNLYWDGDSFELETNQYDFQSSWNASHVTLFFWSKTASVAYAKSYSDDTLSDSDVFFTNSTEESTKADFTVNGVTGKYRTLSTAEWQYLINKDGNENVRKDKYKCGVTVCGKANCLILAPDDFEGTIAASYDESAWTTAEAAGLVCLPPAGDRDSDKEDFVVGYCGSYFSSTASSIYNTPSVFFRSDAVYPSNNGQRNYGNSVRLITESSGGYAPAVKVTGVTISKEETSILVGGKKTLSATVAPANATNKQIIWSSSKPSVATVDATSGEVTGVAKGSANIFATTADGNFKAVCLVTVKTLPAGFVDLGLTSGFFWAEKNLGATNPQDYGKYFSWGDVTGQTPSGSTFSQAFGWNYDVFGQTFNKIAETTACPSGVLASTYDAAYQADNAWRMPTTEDFVELFKECYAEWGTYNGVSGLIVYKAKAGDAGYAYFNDKMNQYSGSGNSWTDATGKSKPSYSTSNDTFIFFPAAGLGYGQDFYYAGSVGYYWSSSLHASGEDVAFCLYFDSIEVTPQSYKYRYHGYSVRPVSD